MSDSKSILVTLSRKKIDNLLIKMVLKTVNSFEKDMLNPLWNLTQDDLWQATLALIRISKKPNGAISF